MPSLSKHDLAKVVAALAVALLTACSRSGPGSEQSLIAALSQELKFQYHDCIPLGWQPVAVAGTYYPGFSAAAPSYEEFSDAIWRGSISFKDLRKPGPRTVFTALNHLVSAGLLERNKVPAGYDYLLRPQALQYYFGSSLYGNNHDLLKYLCYSTIVPQRILWSQRLPYPRGWRKTNAQWYQVVFAWKSSAPAAWAGDPFLRAHGITLAPTGSPIAARMYYYKNSWHVVNIYDHTWMLPATANASAW